MRILQIAPPWFAVPPPRYGGIELVVAALADGLVAAGHDVTLLASGGSVTTAHLRTVYDTPPSERLGDAPTELSHVLAGYADRHMFDLVHDHTPTGAAVGALTDGPPIVHTVHGDWTDGLSRLYRMIDKHVHLVALSHNHAARAPHDVALAGVVHNGFDLDRYAFSERAEGHLAWLGRAGPDKGADVAVEVAERLGRPLRMGMKVNEPDEHRWWREVLQPRIRDTPVDITLNATHEEKVHLLGSATALLVPIRWEEPFGLVMAEANACGTPVVAFGLGAAAEVVADGRTGIIVEPGDVDAMCAAVEPTTALDRGTCRAWAQERFSATRMVDDYVAVYEAILNR